MADIAIFRINYKSDFILTLQSDAGWTTPFCVKFWTGAPSKAYYAYYDGMSYTHCTPVEGEPTKLLVQFDDHHLPIGDLKFQIGYHFTVADFPTSVEDEVINQASVIIEVDDAPAQVMLDFNGETAPEIQFSLPAYANEAQRIANEQARIAAEEQRISNEEARITAEQERQQNEQQRINNEEARAREFARLKTESEAATAAATTAAGTANTAARNADEKAAAAQAAATLANQKAQLAADKAALAQSAATLANAKAQLAEAKAALAQQKADYAQTQGNYAKTQGDAAKTEAEAAHALNEEVREDEDARKEAEQTRQQQETARQQAEAARETAYEQAEAGRNASFQQAESARTTAFNNQLQQQQTAYTEAEAARETAFNEAETERDAKVDAKVADITNLQAQIGYFVCDTNADTAAKTIVATGYALTKGGNIRIKMTNANTADAVTLNINNTDAKVLFYNGAQASSTNSWEAGEVVEVYYDGTQYQCASGSGGKFATGEEVKNTSIINTVSAGSNALPTSNAVNTAIFNGRSFGEKILPIPSVERNFVLNLSGAYEGNTYAHHKIIPVDADTTLKVVAHTSYDSLLTFLTDSDIGAATGSDASITADGNIYTLAAGQTYYFTAPADAKYVMFNTVYGSHGQNQRNVQPQSVSLMLNMEYIESQIQEINKPYSTNTSSVDVSGFVSKTYDFTSGGKYTGTSGNHNYWLDVIAGSVYTITSGDSAINIGWLKSKNTPKINQYADLSLYDGKVYVLGTNSSITIEAPQDAVVMIVSIVPSAVAVYTEKTYKEQVNENATLRNDVDKLKVPVNPITIPSTSYSYWFSYTGSYTGTSGYQHVYLPVTPGYTYRIIGGEVTNYAAFLTQNDGSIAVNTRASLTSDGKIYTIGAGVSVDMEAPQDARYIVFNTKNGTSSIVVSGFGEMLPLDEYLTAEHDPQTIFDFNPSWVVGNLILQARRKLNLNASGGSGTQPLVLLHCSDIHSDKESWDRLIQFYNKYKERIDGAICTGDMCAQTIDSDKSFLSNGGNTVMLTLGNHDVAKTSWNVYDATAQECYEGLFAPYIENWGVQRPSGATYECYYYKDYSTQKVRLIVLDTSVGANSNEQHWNSIQLAWLQSTLESARTAGLSVVIAQHYWAVNSNGRTYVDCTFTCKNPLGEGESIIPADARTAVQSFIDAGGTFICWLSGHTHRDFVYYPTANPKQLGIVVDCASGYASIPKQVCDEDRQAGTKSIDAFNILGIDTYRKIIKIVRIGSDTDSLMRHKGTLTLKYGGDVPEVIYND